MGLMSGKCGLVLGVVNDYSIAWGISEQLHKEGAKLGFTHLPDRDPANPKMSRRVSKAVEAFDPQMFVPCDVQIDDDIDKAFATAKETFGTIDFVVHSIAYAPLDDLKGPVYKCSREGFKTSMDISVYSLMAVCRRASELMPNGGSIITLTYLGGERVIPGYNVMGLCKAALESSVGYLAHEFGPRQIRVHALSAGPIKTLSGSAVKDFDKMLEMYNSLSPLRRNVELKEIGKTAVYLLSDMSTGVTGETLHVDSGYHVMGAPHTDASTE